MFMFFFQLSDWTVNDVTDWLERKNLQNFTVFFQSKTQHLHGFVYSYYLYDLKLILTNMKVCKKCVHVAKMQTASGSLLCVCSTSLSKSLWENEKLLLMSNFSFSHSVFYRYGKLSTIFIKFEIIICKLS